MQKESRLDAFIANPYKSMWTMAMPIIAGMMVQTLFNVVDIMFIGWLGADEVTAVAFVSPLFFIIIGLGVGISISIDMGTGIFIGIDIGIGIGIRIGIGIGIGIGMGVEV